MFKKIVGVLLCIALFAGVLAGCTGTSQPKDTTAATTTAAAETTTAAAAADTTAAAAAADTTAAAAGKAYNVGYSNMQVKEDFFITVEAGIKKACEDKGYEYNTAISDRDSTKMKQNIEALVTKGANIIIDFNVLPEAGEAISEDLQKENIPMLSIDCNYGDIAYFFGVNNEDAGKQLGGALEPFVDKRFGGQIDYVVALWDSQSGDTVKLRCSGATDELKSHYSLKDDQIVWIDSLADDTKTQSMTKDWLDSHPDAKHVVFIGQNDDRGYAIDQAVIAADRTTDCLIGSHNADPSATENLTAAVKDPDSNAWVCTISYNSQKYGEQIINYATDILDGKCADEKSRYAELTPLTTDNIEEYTATLSK